MNMIQALLTKDKLTREEIKAMVHGKLRSKIDLLVEALNGKLTDHHRFLLKLHLENIAFIAEQIRELDEVLQERMIPFRKEAKLIQTIPGISSKQQRRYSRETRLPGKNLPSDSWSNRDTL
ncbi:MAG: hypothetical protein WB392_12655 [Methanotrichaceae archaeon]